MSLLEALVDQPHTWQQCLGLHDGLALSWIHTAPRRSRRTPFFRLTLHPQLWWEKQTVWLTMAKNRPKKTYCMFTITTVSTFGYSVGNLDKQNTACVLEVIIFHRCSFELLVSPGYPLAGGGNPGLIPQLRTLARSSAHVFSQGLRVQDLHDLLQPLPGLLQRLSRPLGMIWTQYLIQCQNPRFSLGISFIL